jgi:peptide/nickel transport system substrate-binding protein
MSRTKVVILAVALIIIILAGTGYYFTQYQTEMKRQAELEAIRKTLVVGTTDKVERGIDPCTAISPAEALVFAQMMDTLYTMDPLDASKITPRLAADFPKVSTDGTAWSIPLRHDVKFTDGTPFNATAVKFSFDRCINLKGPTWDVWYGMVASVEVTDTYTATIHLTAPYGPYLEVLASTWNGIVSPSAVLKMGEQAFEQSPVGSGPFKFVSWSRGEEIVLAANKDYWGDVPKVDKFVLKTIADSATLKLALENGDVDIATRAIAPIDIQSLKNNPNIVSSEAPGTFQQYISFNTRRVQKEVRQAIAYAINYDDILNRVYLGTATRALSVIPPPLLSYKPVLGKYTYDPNKAKQILAGLGITPDNPLHLELMVTPSHYGPLNDPTAVVMKDNLAAVGINVDIKSAEWATFIDLWVAGSYDMLLGGWWLDWPDPDNLVWGMLRSDTYIGAWSGYNNTEMDQLIVQGRAFTNLNDPQRIQVYQRIQDIYGDDIPFLCYVNVKEVAFTRSNVHGFVEPFIPYLIDFRQVYKD